MPTYEFSCHKCELIFEHIYQSVPKKIPQKKKCPECGKMAEKMLSAGNFHMKGRAYRIGKTEVNTFYNEAIRDSKNHLQNMRSPYKRYTASEDYLVKTGQLRLMSKAEMQQRKKHDDKVKHNIEQIVSRSKKK